MSRISALSQLGSLQLRLLHQAAAADRGAAQVTERLSTLKKINRASDDPSGLFMASRLQSQLNAVAAASSNVTRAQSLVNTADAAASEIVSQLETARTLALEVAGGTLSASDKAAKQAQLDDILSAIDRSAQVEYDGQRLLDGSAGFRLSGVDATKIRDVDVVSKRTDDDVTVSVNVTTTALTGQLAYAGGALAADTTLEVSGPEGTATITLSNGATTQDITDAFNNVSYLTGVTATRVDASNVTFATTEYGSAAQATITATAGSFTTTGTGTGRDAVATINGTSYTADGTTFHVANGNVSLLLDIAPTTSGAIANFTVSGSGLAFQLSTNVNDTARIGLANLSTASLGGSTGKLYTLGSGQTNSLTTGDPLTAIEIIDESLADARVAQSRIGSFAAYTLQGASAVLDSQEENLSDAYSDVMDADVAEETAQLTRQQLLQQTSLTALQVFNLQSNSVLSMLQNVVARL